VQRYILERLFGACIVLVVVSIGVFLLVYLTGDPASTMIPLDARPQDIASIKAHFGLDQPIPIQYALFVGNALRGDLGDSFRYRRSSLNLILDRLPATLLLVTVSIVIAVFVAVPLGMLSALKRDSALDYVATTASLLAISTPHFWLGIMLILLFAERLRWLPPSGKDQWNCIILPALTMAASQVGMITRLMRRSALEVLGREYITTARAKGLAEWSVNLRHVLRNALIPTLTVIGMNLGTLIGGSVIIETVFAWSGVGWLMMEAITGRDLPLIRAGVLVMAVFITGINLVVDLSYCYLDPRIKYGETKV
jgi:peptide/nickel transport system permease protein